VEGELVLKTFAGVLLAALVIGLDGEARRSAHAQDMVPASADTDDSYEKKQRRLLISGWTMLGVGLGVGFGGIAAQERSVGAAIGVGALGAAIMLTGGGLLIRRKRLRNSHNEPVVAHDGPILVIRPALGSLTIAGRF
jgi:hypothetical protein